MKKGSLLPIVPVALLVGGFSATAQDAGNPSKDVLSKAYPGKAYSPYAQRAFPSQVFWGDTHLHTRLSADAGLFGNVLGLDEAYRFAKGEEVTASTGQPAKLARPLDWLVIADHSDAMGFSEDIAKGSPNILKYDKGKEWYAGMNKGGEDAASAAKDLITNFAQGTLPKGMLDEYSPGAKTYGSVWKRCIEAAEKHNDPGTFSTIIGFEWTSLVKGNNLHRNVLFRDDASRVSQVEPMVTQPPMGSTDPLDLYNYLEDYEKKTGGSAFAIAHNGNLSNGLMFPIDEQYTGKPIDENYAKARAKWELLYEWTQIKGDGEAHPYLSPNDEFADYETWDAGNLDLSQAKTKDMLKTEYAREALKNGLMLEKKLGVNPYKFGSVGSTDSHTSLSSAEEDNFFGKSTSVEPSPRRIHHPFTKTDKGVFEGYQLAASGWTGVWATENTREAIFDALARKECYATTGPRMTVRFFGGWDFTKDDMNTRQPAFRGYEKGIPMGGDLSKPKGDKAPSFMVYALKDTLSGNLDRIQIIKGWLDAEGKTHERIYDVAVSGNRTIGADGRCKEAVGNTVDIKNATWSNTIGASELGTVWTDPDFDPSLSAFYYARVIEIPTPRWIVYDAFRFGIELPKEAETTGQERAYTSPIWYTP
jgi:hypothetical protein